MPMSISRLVGAAVCGGALLASSVALAQQAPAAGGTKDKTAAAPKKKKGAKPEGTKVVDEPASDDPKRAATPAAPGAPKAPGAPGATPAPDEYGPQLPPPVADNVLVAVPKREPIGRGKAFAAVRIGAAIPQVVSSLGASFLVGGEVGWAAPKLPVIGEGLAVTVDVAFSQPSSSGSGMDPRAGGAYNWSVTQKETTLGLTVLYRAPFIETKSMERGKLVPYLGVGPRLFLLQTSASAQPGGMAVTDFKESSTKLGFGIPLGADYALGPGRVFLEAMFMWAPFNHNSTGPSNAGALTIEAGYRMFFGLGG